MFGVPGDVYSAATCGAPHAIALVFVSCYCPVERSTLPHPCLALTFHQIPATVRTNVCTVVISLPAGPWRSIPPPYPTIHNVSSDLLSRHVNKCHSNEKPPPSAATRKKGSAAARATTSKQACDQCVQSSLPCDGANPCCPSPPPFIPPNPLTTTLAKCSQRKYRCTFVKFHRQTAPTGPGHAPPPAPTSSNPAPLDSRLSMYTQHSHFALP